MSGMTLTWRPTPSAAIGQPLMRRVAAVDPALRGLAASHAARAEGMMKAGAPWQDRTGYARSALYGRAEGLDIHIGTANEEYGLYLELGTSKMAARPIIVPTLEATSAAYYRDVITIVAGVLFG